MRVCIASSHEPTTQAIRRILAEADTAWTAVDLTTLEQAADRVPQLQAELVILVLPASVETGLATLLEVRSLTSAHLIAIGPTITSKLMLRILREGASDYVSLDDLQNELSDSVRRLLVQQQTHGKVGKTIALLAPSGGSGSSTLAVNIATALAKEHKNCALIDLKLLAGDLAPLLDLKPTHTLADLCHNVEGMDRAMFERSLVRHASGVHLLAPPTSLKDVSYVTAAGVRQVLNMARMMYPYVILDIDHSFHEEQLQALRQSSLILLVIRLDFTCLRNTRKSIEALLDQGISQDSMRLVVNRHGQPKEVPAAMAEEALGMKVFHYVPDEPKTVNRANNNGVPVILERPSAWVARSVVQLSMSINGMHK